MALLITRRTLALGATCALLAAGCATMPGNQPRTVLVAGATGQTGRLIVNDLLAEGYVVRALVRDTDKGRQVLGDKVQFVEGDVKDPVQVAAAVAGADAVISAIGAKSGKGPDRPETIDYQGVKNLVDAAVAAKVGQFVLISSRSVTQADNPLNRMFGNVLVWKLKGEDALRASGLAYTVVRPGGLTNASGGDRDLAFEQGDAVTSQTTIARADVARICVAALKYPEARFRTFEVGAREGAPVTDWRAKFAALEADPR